MQQESGQVVAGVKHNKQVRYIQENRNFFLECIESFVVYLQNLFVSS